MPEIVDPATELGAHMMVEMTLTVSASLWVALMSIGGFVATRLVIRTRADLVTDFDVLGPMKPAAAEPLLGLPRDVLR